MGHKALDDSPKNEAREDYSTKTLIPGLVDDVATLILGCVIDNDPKVPTELRHVSKSWRDKCPQLVTRVSLYLNKRMTDVGLSPLANLKELIFSRTETLPDLGKVDKKDQDLIF